jgi:hypothetical protein
MKCFNELSGKHYNDYNKFLKYVGRLSKQFRSKVIRRAVAFSADKIGESGLIGADNFIGIENRINEWKI